MILEEAHKLNVHVPTASIYQDIQKLGYRGSLRWMQDVILRHDIRRKVKDEEVLVRVDTSVSFNLIKHKVFDLLYLDEPIEEMLEQMEKLFLTNTIVIRPNRKSKPRLDKDIHKSTIATNSINHLKRKKKNVGN